MKKFYALSLALCAVTAQAQVTIGQNEMPHAGDALLRTRATNITVNYAPTGPNYAWDFSNLSAAAQETKNYQTVASTNFVYALIYADLAFNPNRANHATDGVDIPFYQILPIANPYTFYLHSPTQYKKVGYGAELSGIPVPITFAQQDVVYQLPLNYGDQSTSSSAYEINVPNLAYYGYAQTRSNDVDGWGSITTPAGTFDALRVHTTLAGRDTINLDTLGLGFAIPRPVVHEYKWLTPGKRVPVLQINTTELFGAQIVTDIWFYDEPRSIDVVAPLASTFCAGGTYTLTYEENGSYNPGGFLVPANVFTAQLSDASGSFANAVNIGTVTSTQSGTITFTIPANTPPGNGYRIRVNANSPNTTGNDNGFDITIAPGTVPLANATAGGLTQFCDGGNVTLSADQDPSYSYQWLLNGDTLQGATGADLLVGASGTYAVMVANSCGFDQSNDIAVAVNPIPVHTLDQASYTSCQGQDVTITGIDQSGVTTLSYQWTLNGNTLPGETTSSITTSAPGFYTLYVTDTQTGCGYTTPDAQLTVGTAPTAGIAAQGDTTFCDGGSVVLDATNADPQATYAWYLDGNAISGATNATLTADSSGSYTVVVTGGNGCASDPSNAMLVAENAPPPTPLITQGSDTLYASGSGAFQWNYQGNPLPGATDAFIETATSGDYTVTVTDANGCSSTSDPYTYIATGLASSGPGTFAVYPNPGDGLFLVRLPMAPAAGDRYTVLDVTGKVVRAGRFTGLVNTVDLTNEPGGVYFLQLVTAGATRTERLVKR